MQSSTFTLSKTYLYKLRLVTGRLDATIDQILQSKAGLTLSQFSLLAAIWEHGAVNQRQVAQFLGVSPAAVKRQTSLAMQRKLLEMAPSTSLQGQALRLTPKGRATIARSLDALSPTLPNMFSESDRQTDLMTHIDLLLSSIKEAVSGEHDKKVKPTVRKDQI